MLKYRQLDLKMYCHMKEAIDEIINDIENNLLPDYIKSNNQTLVFHLSYIKSILKQSSEADGTINIAKVHEALHYIETIKTEKPVSFFSSNSQRTIADCLSAKDIILPETERSQRPIAFSSKEKPQAIPRASYKMFKTIHDKLTDAASGYLQYAKNEQVKRSLPNQKTAWSFPYPKDKTQEVMNQSIGDWQATQMELSDTPQKAYNDFTRDISIRGMVGKTDKDVDNLLDYLIAGANYTKPEETIIATWLKRNGGQENNRFIDYLIMSGAYTQDSPAANLRSESIEQGWTVEDGKIVMNCDIVSYALLIDGKVYSHENSRQLNEIEDTETVSQLKKPLLRFQAKISLDINDRGQVKPSIIDLKVSSFNQALSSPKSAYDAEKKFEI